MKPDPTHGPTPLERAIGSVGGLTALASAIGENPSKVSMWKVRGNVAAENCPAIERATRAANAVDPSKEIVTCEQLRPKVEWDVLRMQIAPKRPRSKSTQQGA